MSKLAVFSASHVQAKAAGHYDDLKEKKFFGGLVKYFASGPIVAMVGLALHAGLFI